MHDLPPEFEEDDFIVFTMGAPTSIEAAEQRLGIYDQMRSDLGPLFEVAVLVIWYDHSWTEAHRYLGLTLPLDSMAEFKFYKYLSKIAIHLEAATKERTAIAKWMARYGLPEEDSESPYERSKAHSKRMKKGWYKRRERGG